MEYASNRQQRLATLLRATREVICVDDATQALNLGRSHTAKLLAGWHKQGLIRRVARGLYVPVSPTALGRTQVLDNPWLLVPDLYEPGYVGGWSALEHWDLTEQIFRSTCVMTAKRTPYGKTRHQGVTFFVKHIANRKVFGSKSVWHGSTKIAISDPHKTILDIIDDSYLGAGLQHVMDVLRAYQIRYSDSKSMHTLLHYAERTNVSALFKKLGYLAEQLAFAPYFVDACAQRIKSGYTHLDKQASKEKLVTKWRLWVPKGYER